MCTGDQQGVNRTQVWDPKTAEPFKASPECTPRSGIHPQPALESPQQLAQEGCAAARSREHTMFREERSGLFLFRCLQKNAEAFEWKND